MVRANALNSIAQTTVYVNPQTGSDTTGNGSAMNPWATMAQANTSITDNSASKVYSVVFQGIGSEASFVIKPFINYAGYDEVSSKFSVTGAGNNVTLDSTFLSASGASSSITNINFSTTNLSFDCTGASNSAQLLEISNCSFQTTIFTGAGTTKTFGLTLTNNQITGIITVTDCNITSFNNVYGANTGFTSTNSTSARTWNSVADKFTGQFNVTETSGQTTTATMLSCAIATTTTVTGATSSFVYDAISFPKGGITFASSGTATPKSLIGGQISNVTQVTSATYTTLSSDNILFCNRAGAIAITLLSSPPQGLRYRIKDISGAAATNNISIAGSTNIDGASGYIINTNYGAIDIVYNGTTWSIL